LNKLVTSTEQTTGVTSADVNRLADALSENCYYYFSPGNRYSYLGFQSAKEAVSLPLGNSRRAFKSREAAEYLIKAAKNWYSPTLITGQLLQTRDSEGFAEVAERSQEGNSPLAKACSFLAELGDYANIVNICLLTAENFSSKGKGLNQNYKEVVNVPGLRSWEIGLYHNRLQPFQSERTNGSPGKTMALGTSVTPKDAVNTCYSLVFYYLSKFLGSSDKNIMGEEMVSVCVFQTDKLFLHAFFKWMLQNGHKDVLLRVKQDDLEKWLQEKQNEEPELLMTYYQIQRKNYEAGELARNRAWDTGLKLILSERIEYLELALSSFSAALDGDRNSTNLDQLKTETQRNLEIAKLQNSVKREMASASTKYEIDPDTMDRLESSLLGASVLLNDFAWPYEMHEICLRIFGVCSYDDSAHICKLWKSFLTSKFLPCTTRNEVVMKKLENFVQGTNIENIQISLSNGPVSQETLFEDGLWVTAVRDSVVGFGMDITGRGSEFVFPVEFIASCLEELRLIFTQASPSNEESIPGDWTFTVLLDAQVPFKQSFEAVYNAMEREKHTSMGGMGSNRRLQMMETAVSMLESYVDGSLANRPGYQDANFLILKAAIDKVRLEVLSIPENVSVLERRLENVEQKATELAKYS